MLHETTSRQTKTDAPVGQARSDAMATKTTQQSGTGWVYFAGTLLLISGAFMLIDGIAAVSNSTFYAGGAKFVFADLNTWGWVLIGLGAVKLLVGAGVFTRNTLAVATGILIAGVSVIGELLSASRYPLWSLVVIALDVLVIYGLFSYGLDDE